MIRVLDDPMSNKTCELSFNEQETFLWKVLEAACGEDCPPEGVEYLCDSISDVSEEHEAIVCTQCYLNWAAKAGTPATLFAKRIVQAIELACTDKCPPDLKDYLCKVEEAEDTSIENCARCLMRWAAMPFWKERNRG